MFLRSTGRQSFALVVSVGVHIGLIALLLLIPTRHFDAWDVVDMSIEQKKAPPSPPVEEKKLPEVEKKEAPKPKVTEKTVEEPPPAPPEEPPPPPEAEKAPPVFDLGDNTFAENGSGAAWTLNRSEGNTKFAGVAQPGQKSARGTAAERGTGQAKTKPEFQPVAAKDLSKRPEPRDGEIKVPDYPPDAKREGIEGRVILQVFIGKDGRVKNVRIIKDPGGGLGAVAKTAMLEERWNPGIDKSGTAVDTVITYAYLFVLDG
jgi:periplasmic protein TonB